MHTHVGVVYAAGAGTVVLVQAAVDASSPFAVAILALVAPIGPVVVGYLLTRRKLRAQDVKVHEIHVLVNSRLSTTLDALQAALLENVRLKDRAGIPVSPTDRLLAAAHGGDDLKHEVEALKQGDKP
jgi:hypothetical protein